MLRIVITGGPCAGKTEISSHLMQKLEERGYKVFWVPETATELILNGIFPSEKISMTEFQDFVVKKQLCKEDLYNKAASFYDPDKVVVFYDRGLLDCLAYVKRDDFIRILEKNGSSFADAVGRYNAVLHMVTAANGAEEFYQWNGSKNGACNNLARSESPAEAREKDKLTMDAWLDHPHLRVFGNATDFKGKIDRVVSEVFSLLGVPVPMEIERKFLVYLPPLARLKTLGAVSVVDIVQTYLVSINDKTERRVRQRGTKEKGFTFFYTEKTLVKNEETGGLVRFEKEEKITERQYLDYLLEADTSLHQIIKQRICFVYKEQFFEMDVFHCDQSRALLEVETASLDSPVELPLMLTGFGKPVEVTNDPDYRNHNLAMKEPCKGFLNKLI